MRKILSALLLLATLAGSAALGLQIPRLRITASTEALLLESDPDLLLYNVTRPQFGTDEYIFVAAELGDPFTPEGVERVEALTREMEALPTSPAVLSLTRAPLLRSHQGGSNPFVLLGMGYCTLQPADAEGTDGGPPAADPEAAREELLHHGIFRDLLISADGAVTGFVVTLRVDPALSDLDARRWRARKALRDARERGEPTGELRRELEELDEAYRPLHRRLEADRRELVRGLRALAASHPEQTLYRAGVPVINVNMTEYVAEDLRVFGWVSGVVALATLLLLLRSIWRTLLCILAALSPVAVVLGAMAVLGAPISVVTCNMPSLLFVLSLAHGIHLVERWRREGAREGLGRSVRGVIVPCFLSAATTAAGFVSLLVTDLRPVIDFGTYMSVGVLASFALAFLIVPAGLALERTPTPTPPEGEGAEEGPSPSAPGGAASRLLGGVASRSLRRAWWIVATSVLVTAGALVGAGRLQVETQFSDYFHADSEITRGLQFVDRRLGGTTPMEIFLEAPEGKYLWSPEGIEVLEQVETYLRENIAEVGKVESLATVVRELQRAMPGASVEDTLGLLNTLSGNLPELESMLSAYIDKEGRFGRVLVRLRETAPELDRNRILERVRAFLGDTREVQAYSPRVTGVFVLHANLLGSLIPSQRTSLALVTLAVFLMLMGIFRSLRAGGFGVIPSILPVFIVAGIMGYLRIPLDLVTVMIASVTLGIGVDSAIHYLYGFRAGAGAGGTLSEAVQQAHRTVGRPILFAALTVILAFGVLGFSRFVPTQYFGLFTAVAVLAALAATLTLLPSCLFLTRTRLIPRRRPRTGSPEPREDAPGTA